MNQHINTKDDVWLVYDGECPACKTYCKYIGIRAAVGNVHYTITFGIAVVTMDY